MYTLHGGIKMGAAGMTGGHFVALCTLAVHIGSRVAEIHFFHVRRFG